MFAVTWDSFLKGSEAIGVRPAFPPDTPEWYTSLAVRCWDPVPKHQPSFRRLVQQLQALEGRIEEVWGSRGSAG